VTALPAATIPGDGLLTWESQVRQYDKVGPPGLSFEQHEVVTAVLTHKPTGTIIEKATAVVDCLLYRNRKGHLVGILNHYNEDAYEWDGTLLESAGNVNVWVRPNRRRRGIGTILATEALRRWPEVDVGQQRYTEAGRALVTKLTGGEA
jgi:GNAT superfamily N-acetyltransferase